MVSMAKMSGKTVSSGDLEVRKLDLTNSSLDCLIERESFGDAPCLAFNTPLTSWGSTTPNAKFFVRYMERQEGRSQANIQLKMNYCN
jgi:hypothetical protein